MQDTFLEKLVQQLCDKYGDKVSDLCIVLPNRRAGMFLKRYFAKKMNKTFWAPEILAIEDFITILSELQPADTTTLLFELYNVVSEIEKDKTESFDDFCKWGQILLNDFNEIDRYCVNANDLFLNLKDYKELETFSLNSDDLTDFQKQYLHFFQSLAKYYQGYTGRLISKKIAYQGLAYKIVQEQLFEKLKHQNWDKIIFAGFNALNKAEERIFSRLLSEDKAEMFWDVDKYYASEAIQEAGYFFRKYKNTQTFAKLWEKCTVFEEDLLANQDKHIEVIGVAKNVAQAKVGGNIVGDILNKGLDIQKTALVLADENLLFPVLHSLPPSLTDINVTMGYPLKNTPVAGFMTLLFSLHENAQKIAHKNVNYSFYYADILRLLSHPYISFLFSGKKRIAKKLADTIVQRNIVFASSKTIAKLLEGEEEADVKNIFLLFEYWENPGIAVKNIGLTIEALKEGVIGKDTDKNETRSSLELEYLFAYLKIINRIISLTKEYNTTISDIKTLKSIVSQIVRSTTLPFYGEPLMGLQIMGMLETRTLDFENVILLSCNEDILPSAKTVNSFIPYELKRYFGLPTYGDKDAIFSYHFYRLLQRAKRIYLVHNTETDELGNGEKSRYLTQLLYELPKRNKNLSVEERVITFPIEVYKESPVIKITKSDEVFLRLEEMATYGFSPSMLNKYISCPLQFYFHGVAGIREKDEVEETIGADTLGTVIHKVLETLYKPYIGKQIYVQDIEKMLSHVERLTREAFAEHYDEKELDYGKNLLTVKVALRFILNFLRSEIHLLKKGGKTFLQIIDLERTLESFINVNGKQIKLRGNADRIDVLNDVLRIIDYKTGKAEDKELRPKDLSDLRMDHQYAKSFQLLMYAYMYKHSGTPAFNKMMSGILSFRELSKGVKPFTLDKEEMITSQVIEAFDQLLKDLFLELFDREKPFVQTEDRDVCEHCSFKAVCSR